LEIMFCLAHIIYSIFLLKFVAVICSPCAIFLIPSVHDLHVCARGSPRSHSLSLSLSLFLSLSLSLSLSLPLSPPLPFPSPTIPPPSSLIPSLPPRPVRNLLFCGLQSVVKLVLAEGSKMVLAGRGSPEEQGVYGLASNLGSLVVRTLFQPVEEAAFLAFSRPGQLLERSAGLLTLLVRGVTSVGKCTAKYVIGTLHMHAYATCDIP
jgi:hypothetical protein